MRHSVGAENGNGAGCFGRFGLWTNCASRINALSGSASKMDGVMVGFCAGMLVATEMFTLKPSMA